MSIILVMIHHKHYTWWIFFIFFIGIVLWKIMNYFLRGLYMKIFSLNQVTFSQSHS